jgi:hypothetical protein
MEDKLATDGAVARQVVLMAARLDDLQGQVDALDRGLLAVGQTADEAHAQTAATFRTIELINCTLARDSAEASYQPHRGDPVVDRILARKRRIAASGLMLVQGQGGAR